MKLTCLNCEHEFDLTNAWNDELGWYTICPNCDSSFDIDINLYLVPNWTKVLVDNEWIGFIIKNTSNEDKDITNILYLIYPTEVPVKPLKTFYYFRDSFVILEDT